MTQPIEAEFSMEGGIDPQAFRERIGAVALRTILGTRVNAPSVQLWQVALIARPAALPGDGPYRLPAAVPRDAEIEVLATCDGPNRNEYDAYRKAELMAVALQVPLVDMCGPELDWRLPEELGGATLRDRIVRINPRPDRDEAPPDSTMLETIDEHGLTLRLGAAPFPAGPAALVLGVVAMVLFAVVGNGHFRHAPDGLIGLALFSAFLAVALGVAVVLRRPDRLQVTPQAVVSWVGRQAMATPLAGIRGVRLSNVFGPYAQRIQVVATFLDFITDGEPLRFRLDAARASRARWLIERYLTGASLNPSA